MAQTASSTALSAREKLYGPGRLLNTTRAAQRMQTSSLIKKGGPYDNDADLESITALSFRRPLPNSEPATAKWTAATQQDTNLSLGHNDIPMKSATQADFTGETVPKARFIDESLDKFRARNKAAPLIPEGIHDIHVADLAPRYMDDKSIGNSLYTGSYQGKDSFRHWLKEVEKEGPPTQRRHKTTLYQKATHFNLGSSQERTITETGSCFSEPASTTGWGKTASTSTEGMTHSSVFRPGDYDVVTGPDEYISVQKKDYTLPSERELPTTFGAGISTKTKNPKSHITERKMAVSGETLSALRQLLVKQNQSEFQNPRDPTSINLTKAFVKFDVDRAGFISADQLVSACQSVGATPDEADALLKECDKTGDGKINYIEFAKYLTAHLEPVDEENYTSIHMDSYRGAGSQQQQNTDDECLGAEYHTTAHFQLGNSTEEPASIYHKDYAKSVQLHKTPRAPQPRSGKVIAQQPRYMKVGSGNSTKQADYVPHNVVEERLGNIQLNSDRHAKVSITISCDKEKDKESRLASVMRSSYRGVPTEPAKSLHFEQEDKKHLESNRALLNPPKDFDKTEFQRSYRQPASDTDDIQTDTLEERTTRTRDNKITHFILGSDPNSNMSEHGEQFQPKLEDISIPVAGKKQGIPQGYSIIPEEDDSVQESDQDEEEGGTALRQRNYLKHINPRDPLNLNLRKCFLEYDKNLSGTVTVDELRKVCKEMNIGVDESTLQDLIQKCDRNQDGMIDYHEFSMYLSKKGLPVTDSATINTVFREDYKHPSIQKMTSMQKLVAEQESRRYKPIHSTSFFRLDHSGETPKSTTRTDFIEPEQALLSLH